MKSQIATLGLVSMLLSLMLPSASSLTQEGTGQLVTVVTSEGYSSAGAAFVFRGDEVLDTAAWNRNLPVVSEFRLPAATYILQLGSIEKQVEIEPLGDAVAAVTLTVEADCSYETVIHVTYEPFKEWLSKSGSPIALVLTCPRDFGPSHT